MLELEEKIRVPEEVAKFDAKLARDKFRVLALGDSITECANMKREERWTALLEALLGPEVRVINAGIGGTSSSLGLYRWRRDVAPMHSHAVVICFLLNDSHIRHYECSSSYLVQCTPRRMEANIRAMLDLATAIGAEPVLWTPPPVPVWGAKDLRVEIQMQLLEMYELILERLATQADVSFVNFWRTFPSLVDEYPGPYFQAPEGYHSTILAQPILAQGIKEALQKPYAAWMSRRRSRSRPRPPRDA